MANGAFKFKDNSGNVVASLSNSGSNIVISGGTLDLSGMTGLTLGNVTMSGTTENASTASFAPSYLLSSSFNSYTGTTNAQLRLSSLEIVTGSVATTGSNIFIGTQTITGSLYISANLVVQGSSSLEDITGSNVYIGTNKINLNTDTPAIRFGGISVFDSGSNFGESGSLLWDSQGNRWIYQHPSSSGAPYKSAILISGPQNSGSLGSEATLTSGKIQKAVGDDHIGDSIITETGGGIGINGSLSISGSLNTTTNIGVGIASPEKRLHLYATNDAASIRLTNTAASKVWDLTPANPNVANNGFTIYNVTDDTKPFYISDNGNIGIGTTTPSGSLHLQAAVSRIYFTQTPTNTRTWFLGTDYSPNGFGLYDTTSNAFRTFWSTSGNVGFGTNDPQYGKVSISSNNLAALRVDVNSNYDAINIGGTGRFSIDAPGVGGGRFMVLDNGNVGIGIDNPTFKLHIRNTTGDDATFGGGILIENTGSPAGEPAIAFKNSAVTSGNYVFAGLNQSNNFSVAFGTSFTDANTKFQITSGGQVLTWGNPAFMAYGNGNSSIDYNGTYLIYPSVHVNRGGHYNSSNGVFTAPVAGIYHFSWSDIGGNGQDVYRYFLRINDATFLSDYHLRLDTGATGSEYGTNGNRCAIVNLSANDTVRIWFRNDAGTTMYGINNNTDSYHNFMGYLIG
jgi:hypothetical protein